jgi:KaiC domain protein
MSEDDEDWFERALRESDADEAEASDRGADGGADAEPDPDAEEREAVEKPEPEPEREPEAGTEATDPDASGFDDLADGPDESGAATGDSPFEEDFASAFENAPDIGAASGGQPDGLDAPGGPAAGGDQPTAEPFAEEEGDFDSSIDRIDLGIEGLDNMILGGVPKRSLISVIGSAGTGKTTFGLQFLQQALSNGERGVYLTLEESTDRIYDTAEEKGWSFGQYADEGRLAVVHLDPVEMANSLASIRNELPELIEEFGADRLVLDSVSLLEMMYDRPSDRRSEVYQFSKSLKEAGVTTLVTSEASSDTAYSSRYGIIEYLADAVFVLQYVRATDFQETRLAVEIQKIRDANHSRETKPYEITNGGLSVYRQANIF